MRSHRKPSGLILGLAAGVALLAVVGGVLLGVYFYLSRQPVNNFRWENPLESVEATKVAPDLSVLSLAGEPDERVFRASMDAGEKETAFAALAYSLLMPDNIRGGHWLLLAPYCRQADGARTGVCYQAALDLAALSPTLHDAARADLSLQAARGYGELGQAEPARMALAQAENIARYSLTLLPAQRRAILNQLLEVYRSSDDTAAAASVQELIEAGSAGPGLTAEPARTSLADLRGSVVLPASVTSAVVARQQAAAQAAASWFTANEGARAALARNLGEALIAEDRARSEFYASATGLSRADRLALQHDKVAWLTAKYRVAMGDFGASLVPAWEQEVDGLRAALAEAHIELVNGYRGQIGTLGAADAAPARAELVRQELLFARLGLMPGGVEATLSEELADASRQLWTRQGNAGLTVVEQDIGDGRFYLLSGSGRE